MNTEICRLHIFVEVKEDLKEYPHFAKDAADIFDIKGWLFDGWSGVTLFAEAEKFKLECFLIALQYGALADFIANFKYEWHTTSDKVKFNTPTFHRTEIEKARRFVMWGRGISSSTPNGID